MSTPKSCGDEVTTTPIRRPEPSRMGAPSWPSRTVTSRATASLRTRPWPGVAVSATLMELWAAATAPTDNWNPGGAAITATPLPVSIAAPPVNGRAWRSPASTLRRASPSSASVPATSAGTVRPLGSTTDIEAAPATRVSAVSTNPRASTTLPVPAPAAAGDGPALGLEGAWRTRWARIARQQGAQGIADPGSHHDHQGEQPRQPQGGQALNLRRAAR